MEITVKLKFFIPVFVEYGYRVFRIDVATTRRWREIVAIVPLIVIVCVVMNADINVFVYQIYFMVYIIAEIAVVYIFFYMVVKKIFYLALYGLQFLNISFYHINSRFVDVRGIAHEVFPVSTHALPVFRVAIFEVGFGYFFLVHR